MKPAFLTGLAVSGLVLAFLLRSTEPILFATRLVALAMVWFRHRATEHV